MNLNFHLKPDYDLHTSLVDELINLYGTPVRFLVTEKIVDSLTGDNSHENGDPQSKVFGDFKTLKTDHYRDALEFNVLISESDEFPNGLAFAFNNFGIINDDTLTVFASLQSLESLKDGKGVVHPKEIVSNLLLFPNGKLMEITDCQLHVPGVNNKFVYSNNPSCYQFSLKSYAFDRSAVDIRRKNDDRIQVVSSKEVDVGHQTIQNLDSFFEKQDDLKSHIEAAATNEVFAPDENNPLEISGKRVKIDDVFGSYA